MMFRSKRHLVSCISGSANQPRDTRRTERKGFGLAEVVAALVILGLFSAGMMVVINGCTAWAANSALRMQAFEIARENMEKLLSLPSVEEVSEEGESEKYPEITYQTVVENFYEPVTNRMWARAVCSATYIDADGEEQTIELEHWLTSIGKEQLEEIMRRGEEALDKLAGEVFDTIEEAALYAGVDPEVMKDWVDQGLKPLPDGTIPKTNVDKWKEYDGNPPPEVVANQIETPEELIPPESPQQDTSRGQQSQSKKTYTADELRERGFPEEIIPLILEMYERR